MATDNLKTLKKVVANYKKRQKGVEEEDLTYNPAKQVEGYKERIEGSGLDAEKETDKRTLFEKAFNLPDEQNPLFDVFEIINRPQQAIFGAIKASQEGRDVGQGALDGLKGNERTQFKEILHNAGVADDSGQKFGADDVVGFLGDVFLDPADLALFPVSASAKAAKLAKLGDKAINVAQAGKAMNATVETLDNANKVRKSLTQLTFQGIGTGFKKTISFADTGIEHLLRWVDTDVVDVAGKMGAKVNKHRVSALVGYRSGKEMLQKTFNYTKGLKEDIFAKARHIKGQGRVAKARIDAMLKAEKGFINVYNEKVAYVAKKYGFSEEEINTFVGSIFENGADTFGLGGKITAKGQKRTATMYSILEGDSWLRNTAIDEATMLKTRAVLDEFFPDIRKSYIDNGTLDDYFVEQIDETGVINKTYRIADENLHKEIKRRVKELRSNNNVVRVKRSASKMTPEQVERKALLAKEATYLEAQKLAGAKKVLRFGTKENERVQQYYREIEEAKETIIALSRETTPEKAVLRKARKDELEKFVTFKEKQINHHLETLGKDIDDVIVENADEYMKYRDLTDDDIIKELEKTLTIDNYLTEGMKKKIEAFGQLEEAPELVNALGIVQNGMTDILREVMDVQWQFSDGYLAHTLTDKWAEINLDKIDKVVEDTWSSTRKLKGDVKSFASRRYKTSTLEANATAKNYLQYIVDMGLKKGDMTEEVADLLLSNKMTDMFTTEITTSVVDFATKSVKATEDAKMLETVLASDVFDIAEDLSSDMKRIEAHNTVQPWKDAFKPNNYKKNAFVRIQEKGEKIPKGYSSVTVTALQEKLEKMAVYSKNDALYNKAKSMLDVADGKRLLIDKNIEHLIGRVSEEDDVSVLLKGVDMLNNMFKKNKLLSPGFQLRNIVGNLSNMWLSGMSVKDIFKYTRDSWGVVTKGENLFKDVAYGTKTVGMLSTAEKAIYDEYVEFMKHGFSDLGNALHDIPEELWNTNAQLNHWKAYQKRLKSNPKAKPTKRELAAFPKHAYNKVVSKNMAMNQSQDALYRMTAWRYAKQNPEFLQKMGYATPEEYVRKTLFDFQDLSVNEREVMRKIIPFYTFTKKNLGYQMQNIMKNTNRYHRLTKSFNNMWDNLELTDDETDKFKVENFWIPIPFIDKDGKYKAIKTSLPLGDMGEFMDRPLQRILSATAPVARAPFEMALNKQVFSEMPIQEFKGQKGFYIPELGKIPEYALSQVGLDVPTAAAFDIGRTISGVAKGELTNPLEAIGDSFGRTVVSTGDPAKTAQRTAYNELDDLQNLMRYYKQEEIDILTLAEIENEGRMGVTKNIIQRLRDINKR